MGFPGFFWMVGGNMTSGNVTRSRTTSGNSQDSRHSMAGGGNYAITMISSSAIWRGTVRGSWSFWSRILDGQHELTNEKWCTEKLMFSNKGILRSISSPSEIWGSFKPRFAVGEFGSVSSGDADCSLDWSDFTTRDLSTGFASVVND